jgi:hypothetical protein
MTREELEHAIRAACDVAGDKEVWIFGSQSILGQHPNAPESLRFSMEVDVDPKNHPERVDSIDGALGEGTQFHDTFKFYVHGVSIETAKLPAGWQDRTVTVRNDNTRGATGYCLDVHDLAASKLAADRDKDREFVRALLRERLVNSDQLMERVAMLPVDGRERNRLARWVESTNEEIRQASSAPTEGDESGSSSKPSRGTTP